MEKYTYINMVITLFCVFVRASVRLYDDIAVLVHQELIYKNMNILYTIPPKKYTTCLYTKEHGYPNLVNQINLTLPRCWNQSKFVEIDEYIKEFSFPKLIDSYKEATQNFTINVLRDVFVSMLQVIYSSKNYYYSRPGLNSQSIWLDEWFNGYLPTRVIGSYDTVVCLGNYNIKVYGHYILDFLSPLMIIPKEIKEKCVIPFAWRGTRTKYIYRSSPFALKGLKFAGIKKEQLVIMWPNDLIFAKEAYIFDELPFNWDCSYAFRRLRDSICRYFPIKIKPFRLGLYNRKPHQSRYIKNFQVILSKVRIRWPKSEVVPDFLDLYQAIPYYQSIQSLFMGFHGSIFGNVLFMQIGTAVCEFMTKNYFTNSLDMTMALGIHHVMGRFPKYIHYTYTPTEMNVSTVLFMIEKCNELSSYH